MIQRPDIRAAIAAGHLAPILSPRQALRYRVLFALWMLATVYFWSWWLTPSHILATVPYLILTGVLIWLLAMQVYFFVIFLQALRPVSPLPEPGRWRVAMITTKTPSEPFSVVRRTLEAMLAQDYPHDTWLADEAPSPETLAWCKIHGVKVSSRQGIEAYHRKEWPRRTRCKEGNLAYFYDHWGYRDYDIVSQLDADHVPQPGYLREMLRPFADEAVGYVSAPSICAANAKESWAARTRLYFEAAFHGVFQAGYTGVLAPMCIGSHYAVRTSALKEAGGLGPELAEDHSTTLLMNAAGWRGVHAIDAIAIGDGPATVTDLITQEFQWSRSLLSLLLRYMPDYVGKMPWRLKFLFVLCQSWYVFFALSMSTMYIAPIIAISFDMRFADVTYPAFVGHVLPAGIVTLIFAFMLRRDQFFRPRDAKIIAWEKALFVMMQWPWVLWGCIMAIYDRLSGKFVDFRITPKGEAASTRLPERIIAVYGGLALGALLPVLLVDNVIEARGFYLLSMFNAAFYFVLLSVIFGARARRVQIDWRGWPRDMAVQMGTLSVIVSLSFGALWLRGGESVYALMIGLTSVQLAKVEYIVSGAGMGAPGQAKFLVKPSWK
ncbi:N-acetylglucosaminyltransferase [Thioclava sp. F34-6]|uniref:glycosyltransferase n=1 Tax=Thioclava sp. F34-6 TaxID=1973003 RepID=UPI000B54031E|nr:glycosyltransferase [Thioclava sp. F34-6]OWY14035.1 N-acetylglucosaminyltransferase [Thioclava sp. F34-6]